MTSTGITIRPIRTEQDHDEALKRIDKLMSAEYGTPEGDELDMLVTLVDAYETKHFGVGDRVHDGAAGADAEGPGTDDRQPRAGVGGDDRQASADTGDDSAGAEWVGDFCGFAGGNGEGEGAAAGVALCV
jgi:hypothetical protein